LFVLEDSHLPAVTEGTDKGKMESVSGIAAFQPARRNDLPSLDEFLRLRGIENGLQTNGSFRLYYAEDATRNAEEPAVWIPEREIACHASDSLIRSARLLTALRLCAQKAGQRTS